MTALRCCNKVSIHFCSEWDGLYPVVAESNWYTTMISMNAPLDFYHFDMISFRQIYFWAKYEPNIALRKDKFSQPCWSITKSWISCECKKVISAVGHSAKPILNSISFILIIAFESLISFNTPNRKLKFIQNHQFWPCIHMANQFQHAVNIPTESTCLNVTVTAKVTLSRPALVSDSQTL